MDITKWLYQKIISTMSLKDNSKDDENFLKDLLKDFYCKIIKIEKL